MSQNQVHPIQRSILMSSTADLTGYWIQVYGQIAYYFGRLEGVSYMIADKLAPTTKRRRQLKRKAFNERTISARTLVQSYLQNIGHSTLAAEWGTLMDDIKAVAPLRNTILHNPLCTSFINQDMTDDEDMGIIKVREGGNKLLLGEVQKYAYDLRDLNVKMEDLIRRTTFPA